MILSGETSLGLGHLGKCEEVLILLQDVSVDTGINFWRLEAKETVRKYHDFIGNISDRYRLNLTFITVCKDDAWHML